MRKFVTSFTLLTFLLASHYCLASAFLSEAAHNSGIEIASHHDDDADHENADKHWPRHGSKKESHSAPCCETFSNDSPTLLPGQFVLVKPEILLSYPLLTKTNLEQAITPQHFSNRDTGPPGSYQDVCLAAPSLRAPPIPVSL